MRNLFGGRRRTHFGHGKDLAAYRSETFALSQRIDTLLVAVGEDIDALRRRVLDPDEAVERLSASEEALDEQEEQLRAMLAPEELHGLHMEYEANLERALRGIVITERGCGITRLPHRPHDDEEPHAYYKRGHANVLHARLRMQEIVEVLLNWEPGRAAEATVAARLSRDK